MSPSANVEYPLSSMNHSPLIEECLIVAVVAENGEKVRNIVGKGLTKGKISIKPEFRKKILSKNEG